MIVADLLILHAEDASQWVACVTESLEKSVTIHIECIEKLEFPLRPSRVQSLTKAKVVLMVISPKFLDFLERSAEDALSVGRLVQSVSTVALLCGLDESSVCCFHKAALLSYENWPRFVCRSCDRRSISQLIVKVQQLLLNTEDVRILEKADAQLFMVPDKVSQENCSIFLILAQLVGDVEKTHVLLESHTIREVNVTKINPYVVHFTVPDEFFECSGEVNVHVRCESKLIAVKQLHCEGSGFQRQGLISELNSPVTPDREVFEEKQIPGIDKRSLINASFRSRYSSGDEFPSLLGLCARYGLQELTPQLLESFGSIHSNTTRNGLIVVENDNNDTEDSTEKTLTSKPDPNPRKERNSNSFPNLTETGVGPFSKETANHSNDELRINAHVRHASSMPSLIAPDEKEIPEIRPHEDDEVCYLPMDSVITWKNEDAKPHERLLQQEFNKNDYESLNNSVLGSNIYVSMKQRFDELNNIDHLNSSQRELADLLNTFKRGVKTISEVEVMFQDWQLRHRDSVQTRDEQLGVLKNKYEQINGRNSFNFINIKSLLKGKSKKKSRKARKEEGNFDKKYSSEKNKDWHVERTFKSHSTSSASSVGSAASDKHMNAGTLDCSCESEHPLDAHDDRKRKESADPPCTKTRFLCHQLTTTTQLPDTPPTPPSRPPPIHNLEKFLEHVSKQKLSQPDKNKSNHELPRFYVKPRDPSPDYICPNQHLIIHNYNSKGSKQRKKMSLPEKKTTSCDYSNEACYLSLMPPPPPKEQLRKQSAPPALRYLPITRPNPEPISSQISSPKPTPRMRQKVHHIYNNVALLPPNQCSYSNKSIQISKPTLDVESQSLYMEMLRHPHQTNESVRIESIPDQPPPSPPSS